MHEIVRGEIIDGNMNVLNVFRSAFTKMITQFDIISDPKL